MPLIVAFSAPVDGGITWEVLQREWHTQVAGAHACLGDKCSALGSSLRRGGTLELHRRGREYAHPEGFLGHGA